MKIILPAVLVFLFIYGCKFNPDNTVTDPGSENKEDVLMTGVLQNGDFEAADSTTLPKYWTPNITGSPQFNFFQVDASEKESGSFSVKVTFIDSLCHPDSLYGSWGGIYQNITINDFTPGNKYFLRFWVKDEIGKVHVRLVKNGDMNNAILSYVVPAEKQWVEYKIAFTIDPTTSFMWLVINTKPALAENGSVLAWIDNIRFTKI